MFSLWVPKVKLRSSATRNLSLELFRDVLVHSLRYTTELTPTHPTPPPTAQAAIPLNEDDERLTRPPSMDALLGKLRQLEMNGQLSPEVLKSRICSDEKHRGTLHHQAKQLQALTTRQIKHLDEYIASLGLQVEGAACPEVCIWKKCLIDDLEAPQGLYRTYIRSSQFERKGARDSTHVKYEIMSITDRNLRYESRFGRVEFFIEYKLNGRGMNRKLLLAYVNDIPIVQETVANLQLYRAANKPNPRSYVINIDNILALVGLVQVGARNLRLKEKYFIEKDTCFL